MHTAFAAALLGVGALVSVGLGACNVPPAASPARVECQAACAQRKDACLLDATSAAAIQVCDEQSARCGAGCPP